MKMKLAINEVTTKPALFADEMVAYSAAGFTAIELWLDKMSEFLEKNSLDEARQLLADNGLQAIGACFHAGVMLSEGTERVKVLDKFRTKLEICQALGAPVLVICTDSPKEPVTPEHYAQAVVGLREAADIAQAYNVSLAVEFIKGARLIGSLSTALDIARKTERQNVGILFDTFHFYAGVSKIGDILQMTKEELLLVHLNDVGPGYIELATDAMRILPGEGVMPLREILAAISAIGYDGYYSLELFNRELWAQDVKQVAVRAFQRSSKFIGESKDA